MKILTFGTLKGGTGKTIPVFSLGGILAELGYNVLLIDVDPQANLTNNLGIETIDVETKTVKNIFDDKNVNIESLILKPIEKLKTLDIIPSTIRLTSTEMNIISFPGREFLLKNYIKKNTAFLSQYDFILFDTNPSMSVINQNALVSSDYIILVNDCGLNAVIGSSMFLNLWDNFIENLGLKNNITGILINKFDKRIKLQKETIEYCNEEFPRLVFKSIIPQNSKLLESEVERLPINIYDKKSTGYQYYKAFTDELLERIEFNGK